MKLEVNEMKNERVAIFGGTFDPPHLGHFILAEQIKNKFNLEKIIFMPAGRPPHKKSSPISSALHRFKMLELEIVTNDNFELSDWELKQPGYSYTALTLKKFVPQLAAEEVFFIIGADSLADIFKWKKTEYLLTNGKFIVFNRPGYSLQDILQDKRYQPFLANILLHQGINVEISSSFIRQELAAQRSIRYLTPAKIYRYIISNSLYR